MESRKPNRVSYHYIQSWDAAPEVVFPLLCPVRELEWADGWAVERVWSLSGVVEEGAIFVTPPREGEPAAAIWTVTVHDRLHHRLEMLKVIPDHTVTRIAIALHRGPEGGTRADVVYTTTALSSSGDAHVAAFGEERYHAQMKSWEDQLNHFLRTGDKASPRG